jgi:hypothetical protein
MTKTFTYPTIREAILKDVLPLHTAYEADIRTDGPAGEAFFAGLYDAWVERIDYSDAWGLIADEGYGPDFDDRIDLHDELARSAVDGLVWYGNIAQTWTDARCWLVDDEVAELTDGGDHYSSIDRMNLALTILAERFLSQLYSRAAELSAEAEV